MVANQCQKWYCTRFDGEYGCTVIPTDVVPAIAQRVCTPLALSQGWGLTAR